jgi:hypothetical protein
MYRGFLRFLLVGFLSDDPETHGNPKNFACGEQKDRKANERRGDEILFCMFLHTVMRHLSPQFL